MPALRMIGLLVKEPSQRDRGAGSAIASPRGRGQGIAVVGGICSRLARSGSPSGARADRAGLAACVGRAGRSRPSPSGIAYRL